MNKIKDLKLRVVEISEARVELIVPLSQYNHWVRMGNECIEAAHKLDLLVTKHQADGNIEDLTSLRNRYIESAKGYYARAGHYMKQYNELVAGGKHCC